MDNKQLVMQASKQISKKPSEHSKGLILESDPAEKHGQYWTFNQNPTGSRFAQCHRHKNDGSDRIEKLRELEQV